MKAKNEVDMTTGKMLGKILFFAIPLMLSGILQLFYNAVNIVVVGRFSGSQYLAAVGSTSSLNSLIVNFFLGLSVGSSVIAARYFGSKDFKGFSRVMHTSIVISVLSGIVVGIVAFFAVNPLLSLMSTPDDLIYLSAKYMKIIFIGFPGMMLYDFGASIIRATGDTKRPLYVLVFSGIVNVALNLLLVVGFNLDVAGAAIATIISQYISAILIVYFLAHFEGLPHFDFKKLCIDKSELLAIIKIGIPSGINSSLFSISNVIIQSAVNSFGSLVVAGNSVGSSLEGFVYIAMNSFHHTALTFASQNCGAGRYDRLKKGIFTCLACVAVVGTVLGWAFYLNGTLLSGIYSNDSDVIKYSVYRMGVICTAYFICGIMDTLNGALRGLGHSVRPMLIALITVCGFRIFFVVYIFPHFRNLRLLYATWPISWMMSIIFQTILLIYILKKLNKKSVSKITPLETYAIKIK